MKAALPLRHCSLLARTNITHDPHNRQTLRTGHAGTGV
jgi:hypothetical protein